MLKIPGYGFLNAFHKHRLRLPADFRLDFVRSDGISAVMPFSVLHIGDQIFGHQRFSRVIVCKHLLQRFYNNFNNLNILFLVMSAHIIGFKKPALFLYHVDSFGVILHVQPVTHIFAVAVYGQLLSVKGIVDDQGNELFRKLVRAVIVGTVGDVRRKMVGVHISLHQHVRSRFAGGIRAVGRIRGRLIEIFPFLLQRTVNLICGNM